MNASTGRRILWIVGALVVLAIVAGVAYGVGAGADGSRFAGPFGRGMMGYGFGLWFLGPLVFFLVVVGIVAFAFSPPPGSRPPGPPASGSGVDELSRLADLHDRGKLTDQEFEAAKRRLLGL